MTNVSTQDLPKNARPSGDGRFLYPFRAHDYLLTREQYLRQDKLGRYSVFLLAALAVVLALAVLLLFDHGFPWRTISMAGIFLVLGVPLAFYWRTAVLLEGCDYREVPKAKGLVARADRWLEANRSLYLDKPADLLGLTQPRVPWALLVYCVQYLFMSLLFIFMLWLSSSRFEGPELVMFAAIFVLVACYWLNGFAVSFYAFWRAIAQSPSGPEAPPDN